MLVDCANSKKKDSNLDSGFGLTILEHSRIVYYSELPIPNHSIVQIAVYIVASCHLKVRIAHCLCSLSTLQPERKKGVMYHKQKTALLAPH